MAGMNDINTAFKQAAGEKVSLIQGRMNYGSDGEHVLEFDVNACGFGHTSRETLPKGADANALVAGAIRCGTRMREFVNGADARESVAQQSAPVERTVTAKEPNQITRGDQTYELVEDGNPEPKPALFF